MGRLIEVTSATVAPVTVAAADRSAMGTSGPSRRTVQPASASGMALTTVEKS